jgi:hypothetical protein
MKVIIEIDCDNDAFAGDTKGEIRRILAAAFAAGNGLLRTMDGRKLSDVNGNTVGSIRVKESAS